MHFSIQSFLCIKPLILCVCLSGRASEDRLQLLSVSLCSRNCQYYNNNSCNWILTTFLMMRQEKRKWQSEMENKRRQLEDDRRELQHMKVRGYWTVQVR